MAIKSNLEKHTVQWLYRQDQDGKLNKNISIQRKEVWDIVKKSNLIISILLDIPIESLLFEESDNDYNVLDGKQRTLTLCAYLADAFALSPKIRVKEIGGTEMVGLKFSELPEPLQTQLMEYELSISILRPLGAEERATVFFMRNQAVALTGMDLSLVMLGETAMDEFNKLREHPFMTDIIKMTEPARRKHVDLQVLLQYLILVSRPDSGFSSAEIMSFCDDIKSGETEIDYDKFIDLLDYLTQALRAKRQYLKKVHIPAVLYAAREALGSGTGAHEFGEKLDAFFENLDERTEYSATYASGSSKRTNVRERVRLLVEALVE